MRIIDAPEDPHWHGVVVGDIADIPDRIDVCSTTDENARLVDDVLVDEPVDLGAALAYAAEQR